MLVLFRILFVLTEKCEYSTYSHVQLEKYFLSKGQLFGIYNPSWFYVAIDPLDLKYNFLSDAIIVFLKITHEIMLMVVFFK